MPANGINTDTLTVQLPLAGMLPPLTLIPTSPDASAPPALSCSTAPTQVVDVVSGLDATMAPGLVGKISSTPGVARLSAVVLGLLSTIVKTDVPVPPD